MFWSELPAVSLCVNMTRTLVRLFGLHAEHFFSDRTGLSLSWASHPITAAPAQRGRTIRLTFIFILICYEQICQKSDGPKTQPCNPDYFSLGQHFHLWIIDSWFNHSFLPFTWCEWSPGEYYVSYERAQRNVWNSKQSRWTCWTQLPSSFLQTLYNLTWTIFNLVGSCDRTPAGLLITQEAKHTPLPNQCGSCNVADSELSGVSQAKLVFHFWSFSSYVFF